ncbi:MAG: NADH/ubiquinone/plastoquinone (complex I) [Streptosporangiales bacterium]|nr:NADH/ubiquinone/plastoquinone (complex I) [Streptosporangiales bacterium]
MFLAGLALLAAAALLDLAAGVRRLLAGIPYLLGVAGSACLLAAGAGALAGHGLRVDLGAALGLGSSHLAADPLSGLFLVVAFGAAVPVSLAFASWATSQPDAGSGAEPGGVRRRGVAAAYALTLAAVAVIVTAGDAFVLLFAWEALTIAFFLLACFGRQREGRTGAALITLVFGKVSGVALLLGLLMLAAGSGSLTLDTFHTVPPGLAHTAAYALLVAGFAVKVGLVPVHVWLPRGYTAAPGPARALMAGVAVNVGFYGLWRTLALLGPPPGWLVTAVLLLAGLTAILGIAHAAVHTNLQRVIAYSSVENTGLILAGYGVALVGAILHNTPLVAVGLLAATLQLVAHVAAKSLLFTASSGIEAAAGTSELDALRGAARRTPWSGTGFAVGALTLAGLPPTVGFVSEWFLLEALMQQFRLPGLGFKLVMALAGAAVALTAGFAGVTFVRLLGLVVLGPAPPATPSTQRDVGVAGRVGIVTLALGCLAVAAVSPWEIRMLAAGLAPLVPAEVTLGALKSPWVLQPVFDEFSILSPSWLWIAMPALLALVAAVTLLASGARPLRVRRVPAWRSATAGVEGADQYTAFGYTNPTRRVLANVLLTRAELRQLDQRTEQQTEHPAADGPRPAGPRLGYTSDVVEVVEQFLYRPLARPLLVLVKLAKRLQSGRLEAYIAYMLIALIAVLAVVTALA